MAYLVNPPTLVSVSQFKGFANDFDLTSYTDSQLQDKLCAATAAAEAICRREILAREQTFRYLGDGTDKLDMQKPLVLYVKRAQIVIPGPTGFSIPVNELLVDYSSGDAFEYAPLYFAGAGYRSIFPYGAPIDITLAWGYGYTAASAPSWTAADVSGGGLAAGTYNVAVTTRTFWGETTATVKQYTTSTGSFAITVTLNLGAYVYRVYVSDATHNTTINGNISAGASSFVATASTGMNVGDKWLLGSGADAEVVTIANVNGTTITPSSAVVNAHTTGEAFILCPLAVAEMPVASFGTSPITMTINSTTPQNQLWADSLPVSDTSAPPLPWGIQEAVRLLTLSALFEQNNPANRGVYQQRSGERMTSYVSTEGRSGKGVPTMWQQATELLSPFMYRGIA